MHGMAVFNLLIKINFVEQQSLVSCLQEKQKLFVTTLPISALD
jgi:hypothetical protein